MIHINHFLCVYLSLFLLSFLVETWIDFLNVIHLKKRGRSIPDGFGEIIVPEKLAEMNDYTIDQTILNVFNRIAGKALFLFIILSGFLPWISEKIAGFPYVLAGLGFFVVPGLATALIDLPFDYYHIFKIEEKYGFNTQTVRSWVADLLKSMIIASILGALLLSLLLLMVRYSGNVWWIWAWLIFFAFQLLMTVIYPTLIAPIFNKFTPIEDNELAKKIEDLSHKEGLVIKGIFQMDAARRSRHTNAYFTGLGKSKRIVLYDTLLNSHEDDEILAVLAHEIGHLKRGHIKKQLMIIGIVSLILFFLASRMIEWKWMFESFGFSNTLIYVGLFLIAVLWEPVGFFLSPLAMVISRRFEREADQYVFNAFEAGKPLIRALKKMALDNLSNLHPHPLFVCFHYSHPPLTERIKNLKSLSDG